MSSPGLFSRIDRLRLLALLMWALPLVALLPLGMLWLWQSSAYLPKQRPGEEAFGRRDATFNALDIAGFLQARDQVEDASRGGQAHNLAKLGHGRKGVVPLPVRAQLL